MATAVIKPPVPVEPEVVLTLSHSEAHAVNSFIYSVAGFGGPVRDDLDKVQSALQSVLKHNKSLRGATTSLQRSISGDHPYLS